MSFGNPLGLLALLAIPAVLALHLLRRRRRERRVAGLFLFAEELRATPAGRRLEPLRRSLSLVLELAAATLLAVLVAEPRFGDAERPEHLVVVLDDSASMGATTRSGPVVARARRAVEDRIGELGGASVVTLVRTGPRADVLAGPRVPPSTALEALARWAPARTSHDVRAALDVALELAGTKGRVVFVTDRPAPDAPPSVDVVAVGEPGANVAIVSGIRDRHGENETIRVALRAYADAPLDVEVGIDALAGDASRSITAKRVRLEPEKTAELSLEVPRSDLPLRVGLSADALAVDSTVTLLPRPRRVVGLAWTLDDATARRLGLARMASILEDVVYVADPAQASLLVTVDDGPPPAGGLRLVVAAPGAERDDWLGPFLRERRDPLLDGVTLDGIVWSAGRGLIAGRPLVSASGEAMLLRDPTPDGTVVRLNLDVARSTLPSSADWPILVANLVEEVRRELPGVVEPNVRVGGTLALRHAYDAATAAGMRLVLPSGRTTPLRGRRLSEWDAEEVGLHRLEGAPGAAPTWSVAFVDPSESDLRGAATLERAVTRTGPASEAGVRSDEASLLRATGTSMRIALLALLLLATAAFGAGLGSPRRVASTGARR